jgi:DNA-binding NarL/FixJ family response regulator
MHLNPYPSVHTTPHLFISPNGEMLPRWQQAFAQASAVTTAEESPPVASEFVWLRLRAGLPVAEQVQRVRNFAGDAAIVVLSDTPSDDEGMAAFSASARGYCNSHASAEVLRQVATVVGQGGLWIGESLMARLLVGVNRLPPRAVSPSQVLQEKLTEREREVALAVSRGASNKEVARQLGITERTVKAHVSIIFTKLAVQDRLHLALRIRELHIA